MVDTRVRQGLTEHTRVEICSEIHRLLAARKSRAAAHGPQFEELWSLASQCLTGGKLLRPQLLIGAFDALTESSGTSHESRAAALEIAAAVEILHFAFLLHDDIIDEDLLRRGEPNLMGHLAGLTTESDSLRAAKVHTEPRRLHWARSSGILIGDLMLTIAHQLFARAQVPDSDRIRMLDLLDDTVTETVAGEYCDVGLAAGCITPDLNIVLDMTRMKTATYTFELPLRVAAIMAGTDPRVEHQLGQVGRHLGIAFQLQDDLLSAFSMSTAHGKDQFSDFRERKETALIAFARDTPAWPHIDQLLCSDTFSIESGRAVQELLTECGARAFIDSMVEAQINTAFDLLAGPAGEASTPISRFVAALIEALTGRRS